MNNAEALLRFNVGYDSLASNIAKPYETFEINSLMNQAMMGLISALNAQKAYDKLVEITVAEKSLLAQCTIEELGDYAFQAAQLTTQFLYYINSHVLVKSRTEIVIINNEWIKGMQIERRVADYYVQSAMNSQVLIYPAVFVSNSNTPVVMTDKYTTLADRNVIAFEIVYIKQPVAIDLSGSNTALMCELHTDWHEVIVDKAIMLAKVASDEDRLKMTMRENQSQQKQK